MSTASISRRQGLQWLGAAVAGTAGGGVSGE